MQKVSRKGRKSEKRNESRALASAGRTRCAPTKELAALPNETLRHSAPKTSPRTIVGFFSGSKPKSVDAQRFMPTVIARTLIG